MLCFESLQNDQDPYSAPKSPNATCRKLVFTERYRDTAVSLLLFASYTLLYLKLCLPLKFFIFSLSIHSGVCFHWPSRICTSSLSGCGRCAASVEVWSWFTTTHSCATPTHCHGRISSIPPRVRTASSATTRTLQSVVSKATDLLVVQLS